MNDAIYRHFHLWKGVADCINPLLGLWLLAVYFFLRRRDPHAARCFGARALFSLLVAWAIVRDLRYFIFSHFSLRFPSGHLAFALCAAISLGFWKRDSWKILLPLLLFYAWLMTALSFHNWLDMAGAIPVAFAAQGAFSRLAHSRLAHLRASLATR